MFVDIVVDWRNLGTVEGLCYFSNKFMKKKCVACHVSGLNFLFFFSQQTN